MILRSLLQGNHIPSAPRRTRALQSIRVKGGAKGMRFIIEVKIRFADRMEVFV
jgi:hypothetical protein